MLKQQAEADAAAAAAALQTPKTAHVTKEPTTPSKGDKAGKGRSSDQDASGWRGNASAAAHRGAAAGGDRSNMPKPSAETKLKANSSEPWVREKLPPVPDRA